MQIVINIEPKPQGHLVIGTIVERITKAIMGERADRGEFVLRSTIKGEVVEHQVSWGIWP